MCLWSYPEFAAVLTGTLFVRVLFPWDLVRVVSCPSEPVGTFIRSHIFLSCSDVIEYPLFLPGAFQADQFNDLL